MKQIHTAIIAIFALLMTMITPAFADLQLLNTTGNPLTAPSAPYLVLSQLTGHSACSVSVTGTFGGAYLVEGIYSATQPWSAPLTLSSPDGVTTTASITAAGNYIFNCANMIAVRVDGTTGTGTPVFSISAGGGVNKTISTGVNGGRTTIAGTTPIVVTNAGTTATVSCPTCATTTGPGSTQVQAGTGISVATPSPGVFVVSNTGITGLTAGSNIVAPLTGPTPTVSVTNAPVFTGPLSAASLTGTGLTSGNCVQAGVGGLLGTTAAPCAGASGVTNVAAGTNILVANPTGPTATVSFSNNPVIGGYYYAGTAGTSNDAYGHAIGADSGSWTYLSDCMPGVSSCFVGPVYGNALFYSSQAKTYMVTDSNANMAIMGYFYTPQFLSAGNLTAGNCLQGTNVATTPANASEVSTTVVQIASTSTACATGTVNNVVAGSNIVVTNPAGPSTTVATSLTPSFTSVATTGPIGSHTFAASGVGCVTSAGTSLTVNPYPCTAVTGASFVIPAAISGTVSVTTSSPVTYVANAPLTITDGTNSVSGIVSAAVSNSTTFTFLLQQLNTGAFGATVATAAPIYSGATSNSVLNFNGATAKGLVHTEAFNNQATAAALGTTATYLFKFAYTIPPVCNASQSVPGIVGALASSNGLAVGAPTVTSVIVTNNTGAAQTPNVVCVGF